MMMELQIAILTILLINLFFSIKKNKNTTDDPFTNSQVSNAIIYGTSSIYPFVPEAIEKIEKVFKEKQPIHESYPKIKEICGTVADICLKKAHVQPTEEIKNELTNTLMTKYIDDLFSASKEAEKFNSMTTKQQISLLNN